MLLDPRQRSPHRPATQWEFRRSRTTVLAGDESQDQCGSGEVKQLARLWATARPRGGGAEGGGQFPPKSGRDVARLGPGSALGYPAPEIEIEIQNLLDLTK